MSDITKNICWNEQHPEYNGEECACVWCVMHTDHNFCAEDPCEYCDGPVQERCDPQEDEKILHEIATAKVVSYAGDEEESDEQ